LREKVIYGATAGQQFGYAVAADYKNVLIGSNNKHAFGAGSVQVYQRQATDSRDYDRPVISGPLFKRVYTLSASLSDSKGNNGDKFGTSLSLYKNQVLVGSYLKGLTSVSSVGTGAAYIYNAIRYIEASQAPIPAPATSSSWFTNERGHIDTSSAVTISVGATFLLLVSVLGAYGVYKYQGGKTDAMVVLGASWETVKDFGASVTAKLPFKSSDSKSRVSLSSMDESTNSVTPMNMDSSHGSYSSSSSTSSAPHGRFQGHGGASSYPPPSQSRPTADTTVPSAGTLPATESEPWPRQRPPPPFLPSTGWLRADARRVSYAAGGRPLTAPSGTPPWPATPHTQRDEREIRTIVSLPKRYDGRVLT